VTSPEAVTVDLLEEIRAVLDGLGSLLLGRTVDIEMSRLRVLAEPTMFRRTLAELIELALANSEPADPITVRVTRAGKAARVEVVNDDDDGGGHGSMTLPMAPAASSAPEG
jgi:signal transduction histidine kinase